MAAPRASSRRSSSDKTNQFNTGGNGATAGTGASLYVILDGKNVTPRSLLSFLPKPQEEAPPGIETVPLSPTSPLSPSQTGVGFRRGQATNVKGGEVSRPQTASQEVVLTETMTRSLFHLPTLCVSVDQQSQYQQTLADNRKYEELCQAKTGSRAEAFRPRHVQTLNPAVKHKEIQAVTRTSTSVGVGVSEFDIYDAFLNPPLPKAKALEQVCAREVARTLVSCLKKPACLIKVSPSVAFPPPVASEKPARRKKHTQSTTGLSSHNTTTNTSHNTGGTGQNTAVLQPIAEAAVAEFGDGMTPEEEGDSWAVREGELPEFLASATRIMEKTVAQNNFHAKHMAYRNYPSEAELAQTRRTDEPRLEDLFVFEFPEFMEDGSSAQVTSLEWSEENKDLLVAGYVVPAKTGQDAAMANEGLVLFWSLKNPLYPERVIRQRPGITALAFSRLQSYMLAVGGKDGTLTLYDLRKEDALIASVSMVHSETIESLAWIDRGAEKIPREALVSVGADGAVFLWTLKKALEGTQVMTLKRETKVDFGANPLRQTVTGSQNERAFKKASALCLDFPDGKNNVYLVGTDDGVIHKCSTAYTEQDIEAYRSHTAPVYQVRTNPFMDEVFLSCAADWSIRLWHAKQGAISVLQSIDLSDAVNDVEWSHLNATAFAAVADDGRVELWDLTLRPLDPIIVHFPSHQPHVARTCVRFSRNSPVVVAGDAVGKIAVMRIYNCEIPVLSEHEQQQRLLQCLSRNNN